MPNETERNSLLVRYLLGELSDTERDELEDDYLPNSDLHDELLATEDELIFAYAQGRLSPSQRDSFERLFLCSSERQSRLEFARGLTRFLEGNSGIRSQPEDRSVLLDRRVVAAFGEQGTVLTEAAGGHDHSSIWEKVSTGIAAYVRKPAVVGAFATSLVLATFGGAVAMYQLISSRVTVNANAKAPSVQVLVAARNLEIGTLIKDSDFKIVEWIGAVPTGAIVKKEDALGRGAIIAIFDGEPLIESRLAPKGRRRRTRGQHQARHASRSITRQRRQRAGRLRHSRHACGRADLEAPDIRIPMPEPWRRRLLQNIEIVSAGQNIQKDAEGKPVVVNLVNVLVTPDQVEILNLATNDTRVQLVLRNPIDHDAAFTHGRPPLALRRDPPPPLPPAQPARPKPEGPYVLEIINGNHRIETIFEK